jgi:hypothetical protein
MDVRVPQVLEEYNLHQDNLITVVSLFRNVPSIPDGHHSFNVLLLKWEVDDQPVKEGTDEVNHYIIQFNKSEREIVFVMPVNSVKLIVSIVFVENSIQ